MWCEFGHPQMPLTVFVSRDHAGDAVLFFSAPAIPNSMFGILKKADVDTRLPFLHFVSDSSLAE